MKNYIVVRLENLWVIDDNDGGAAGPEGEIQYLAVVSTADSDAEPIVTQRTGFPLENWYEAEGNGVNSSILDGDERALPLFCFPEEEMGERLLINITAVDNDETAETAIIGHAIAARVGTIVAGAAGGPVVGGVVEAVSNQIQSALEEGTGLDLVGTHTHLLRRSQRFGMEPGTHAVTFDSQDGKFRVRYTVMRVTTHEEFNDWLCMVTLNEVKILEDGDGDPPWPLPDDAGDIFVRARVANGYSGELLRQRITRIPASGTKSVHAGHQFLSQPKRLYFNNGNGLPPFLFVEVDVCDSDDGIITPGSTGDDVLGVLPLMFTNRWLREHPGSHPFEYVLHGNDPGSEKCRIKVTVDIWDPNEAPF